LSREKKKISWFFGGAFYKKVNHTRQRISFLEDYFAAGHISKNLYSRRKKLISVNTLFLILFSQ